jgi:MFS family permease
MTLELVGGRLIARHLGSSLYTWTSIIGVVLAGISMGNYAGGYIADRFGTRKTMAVLFGLSSVACVLTVASNNLVSNLAWLGNLGWPMRVATHIFLVFLVPSILLGTIAPVVVKRALEYGLSTGRTIGDLYAWGAIGSIAGTFITGFYLIAKIGTIATIWGIGAVLLIMSILYWHRYWLVYVWATIFIASIIAGQFNPGWVRNTHDPKIIYENES